VRLSAESRATSKAIFLELGCGRGEFAIWLASAAPDLRVTGVDFSTSAITIARSRITNASKAVRFLAADVQSVPFVDNSFDWIVSCECLEHLPEPQRMAAGMFRVLKPGGRFCPTTENYLNGMLLAWLHCFLTGRPFNAGSGVQPLEQFFVFPQVKRHLKRAASSSKEPRARTINGFCCPESTLPLIYGAIQNKLGPRSR